MRRRDVLHIGAVFVVAPLVGCAAEAPPPEAPPAPPPAPPPPPEVGPPPAAPAPVVAAEPTAEELYRRSLTRLVARVGKNHGHVFTISFEDVKAGAEKTYDVTGRAPHPHTVTVTVDHMKRLMAGELVRVKSSSTNNHLHNIVLRCAPEAEPPQWINACNFTSSGKDEHEIIVTQADLDAKAEKTYDVQGLAGHSHKVTLAPADFEKLLAGGPVTRKTSRDPVDAHLHTMEITRKKPTRA